MTTDRKIVISVAVAAAVALFFLGRCNGIRSVTKTAGMVVTVTKDSLVYVDRPVPYKVDSLVYVKGKDGKPYPVYDTLCGPPEVRIEPVDTGAILRRFYDVAYYRDVRDTGRAKITIHDTVTQNRIAGRSVKIVFTDTATVTTMILKPPRKFVGYWTLSAAGNLSDPFVHSAGIGLGLKFPGDMIIQMEGKVVRKNKPMIEGRIMIPIRLK